MTSSIHDALTPPERVAHLLQEWYQVEGFLNQGNTEAFLEWKSNIKPKDLEAIDELLKDYDRYKEKYAAMQTRCYVAEQPKMPANKWVSKSKEASILYGSVIAYGVVDAETISVCFENSPREFRISGKAEKKRFIDGYLAYREWRDATD